MKPTFLPKFDDRAKRNSHSLGETFGRLAGGDYNEYVSTHPAPLRRASYLGDRYAGKARHRAKIPYLICCCGKK